MNKKSLSMPESFLEVRFLFREPLLLIRKWKFKWKFVYLFVNVFVFT